LDTLLQKFSTISSPSALRMLTLTQCETSIQVTSSPVLAQLLVLLVGKLVGRNTNEASYYDSQHHLEGKQVQLEFRWRTTDPTQARSRT